MNRKINFNAGPTSLPEEVLREAADAVLEYNNTGVSILELPHREKEFLAIVEESKALVKELCEIGDDYEVLWLHGGGRLQFCMIPMNFLGHTDAAGYIDTDHWAEVALEYATHFGEVQILATSKQENYRRLPEFPTHIPHGLAYVHYTTNSTIAGTQWHHTPVCNVPLIADMSSDIFCSKRDYSKYAMVYAAVQKNLGTPGVALVILRKDMFNHIKRELPPMLNYHEQAKENSILNTANVFGIYLSLLMLRWTKQKGIDAIEKENRQKAKLLYDVIDGSSIFTPHVTTEAHRSLMNVCFTANNPQHEKQFIDLCTQNNIIGIKGHRSVGGFRVSLYNSISADAVKVLVGLMKEFEKGF